MIRGINRKVIEVKHCNSSYFERACLVVKSDKSRVGDDLLNFNAELFVSDLAKNERAAKKIRKKRIHSSLVFFLSGAACCLLFFLLWH